jgi:hypothetical protein
LRTHDYIRDEEGVAVREPVVILCGCGKEESISHAVVRSFFELCKEAIPLVSLEITRAYAKVYFLLDDNEQEDIQRVRVATRITNHMLDRVREAKERR